MLVEFSDQVVGNSTPSCSKATEPSFQLVMRASRNSQTTSSNGSTPGEVNNRLRTDAAGGGLPFGGERHVRSFRDTSLGLRVM